MIQRRLLPLVIVFNCVLSLPVASSQLESGDVEVMKCIVEALADVLSRPRLVPISQGCLVTLKTDDRLLTILRHVNFLKELQEIAVQGEKDKAGLQGQAEKPAQIKQTLQPTSESPAFPDQSMLEALGGAGERSILSGRRRDVGAEEKKRRGDGRGRHEITEVKGAESGEKRDPSRNISTKTSSELEEEGEDEKSSLSSKIHKSKEDIEDGMKRGDGGGLKRWTKRTKLTPQTEEAHRFSSPPELGHHSKEVIGEEQEEKKKRETVRSLEEKELLMIARRAPEEDEGSGATKPEEPEIESLAAIESELENVAQKLHELRRG